MIRIMKNCYKKCYNKEYIKLIEILVNNIYEVKKNHCHKKSELRLTFPARLTVTNSMLKKKNLKSFLKTLFLFFIHHFVIWCYCSLAQVRSYPTPAVWSLQLS